MKAGFAERDITPASGLEMPGPSARRCHDGTIHDPCKVRAAVFEAGSTRAALVSVDAVIVPDTLVRSVRSEIAKRCNIAPDAVMIAATHSHSAGPVGLYQPGQFDHAPYTIRQLAYEYSSCADPLYLNRVRAQIVTAVSEAYEKRRRAHCGVGLGHEPRAAFNRRFRMRNGRTYTFPGQGNPDILEPAGPIDPTVGVLGAWTRDGERLLGCIINYACHPTTKPGGTSADWIFYMEQVIRGAFGREAIVLFMNGACGDVTPVDTTSRYTHQTGERWARKVGARVGAEALKVLLDVDIGEMTPVISMARQLRIARRRPTRERLEWANEVVACRGSDRGSTDWFFAKELVLLEALVQQQPEAVVELQALQIGPAVFLASPGELFCQLGLDLKAASPFPFTFPVSLANGFCGYLPTVEALGPTGGGYETRLTGHTNLDPDAGPRIVVTLAKVASELRPGSVPHAPSPPRFSDSWSFGNVPVEPSLPAGATA